MIRTLVILLGALSVAESAVADRLSNEGLFVRCYSQLTQERPLSTSPLLLQVRQGRAALEACKDVLESAVFRGAGGTEILDRNSAMARAVLATMNNLHNSWWLYPSFPAGSSVDAINLSQEDFYDSSRPGLYFTRALFGNDVDASSIVTSAKVVKPVRSTAKPSNGPASGTSFFGYVFGAETPFAAVGPLLGAAEVEPKSLTAPNVSVTVDQSFGGGILGDPAFLLMTGNLSFDAVSDGGSGVRRRWAKSVYRDLLCHELPAVREADSADLVDPTSAFGFRGLGGCTSCHASMDRIASTTRNIAVHVPLKTSAPLAGVFLQTIPTTMAKEVEWPKQPDANFSRRPPTGKLFFRSHTGELIDEDVDDLADLGRAIAAQDDFYICTAKHYYEYFLGVEVDISEPERPFKALSLDQKIARHREAVVTLGKSLKQHQNLRQLILDIMGTADYRDSGFTTEND